MSKSLVFELKIEGLKSELDLLAKLEKELLDTRAFIREFRKAGEDFTPLLRSQEQLKLRIRDVRKEISQKNAEFQQQFQQGETLANKQRAWAQTAREMQRLEQQEIKRTSTIRKKDVEEAVRQDEIKKKSLIGLKYELEAMRREYAFLSDIQRKSSSGRMLLGNIQRQNTTISNIEQSQGVFNRNVGNYPRAVGMIASNFTGGLVGSGAAMGAVAGAGLVIAAAKQIKQIIQLNSEIDGLQANVRKTTGLNNKEVESLTKTLKDLDTSTTLQELLKISEEAGRFGVTGEKAVGDFTQSVNLLNIALGDEFGGGVEQITTEISQLSNVLNGTTNDGEVMAERFQHLGNALNVLANSGSATAGQIADIGSRIGGTGRMFGYTNGQILGIASSIKELGIDIERGSTAFNKVNSIMRKNSSEFAKLVGMTKKDYETLLDTKPFETFQMVIEKVNEKAAGSGTKATQILSDLGIKANGATELFVKMGSGMELVTERVNQGSEAIGNINSLLKEQQNMMDSVPAQWKRLGNAMSDLFVNSGLQSNIKNSLKYLGDFVEVLQKGNWSDKLDIASIGAARLSKYALLGLIPGYSDYIDKSSKRLEDSVLSKFKASPYDMQGQFGVPNNSNANILTRIVPIEETGKTDDESSKTSGSLSRTKAEANAAAGSVEDLEKKIRKVEDQLNKTSDFTKLTKLNEKLSELNSQLDYAKDKITRSASNNTSGINPLADDGQTLAQAIEALVLGTGIEGKAKEDRDKSIQSALDQVAKIGNAVHEQNKKNNEKRTESLKQEEQNRKLWMIDQAQDTTNQLFDVWEAYHQRRTAQELSELERTYAKKIEKVKGNATLEAALQRELEDKKLAIEKEARKKSQAMAIAQALINGALAITNIWANTIDVTPFQGFKIAASIASGFQTALQIAAIKAQSFAKGGYTGKGSGSPDHTGQIPVGIVHEDEYVVNKTKLIKYRPLIDAIHNDRVPGFAMGGGINYAPIPQIYTEQSIQSMRIDKADMMAFAQIVATETAQSIYTSQVNAAREKDRIIERQNALEKNIAI